MISLILGAASYIVTGILSLLYPRYKFWFSFLGWSGGLAGLVSGIIQYKKMGSVVDNLGRWGVLGIELKIDITTLLFVALVVVLNIFTLFYLRGTKEKVFFCLYNFLLAASYSIAFSNDLFNIYVTIELMSLIAILLIGYERKHHQIYAGIKYLIISSLAMSIYLIGLGFLYRAGGHLGISKLARALEDGMSPGLSVGVGLMVVGLAVKGGIFLFSMWLPDAYLYSDTIVSTLLAGVATKAGLIGIIRISALADLNYLILGLGTMTGVAGIGFAITSRRPKKILAFSSLSQVGYILLGVGVGTPAGLVAASLHIFFHGLFKGLLFLSVGHAEVGGVDIYGSRNFSVPLASKIGIAIGTLSLIAIPPFSGYFSKSLLLEEIGRGWVWGVFLIIGLGTVIYGLELNRALLIGASTESRNKHCLPVLGFSVAVGVSSFAGWVVLGEKKMVHLFTPLHIAITFTLLLSGGIILLGLYRKLQDVKVSTSPFELDNALVSIFVGYLLVIAVMVLL